MALGTWGHPIFVRAAACDNVVRRNLVCARCGEQSGAKESPGRCRRENLEGRTPATRRHNQGQEPLTGKLSTNGKDSVTSSSSRPEALEGLTDGFLDNARYDGSHYLSQLFQALRPACAPRGPARASLEPRLRLSFPLPAMQHPVPSAPARRALHPRR